MVEELMAHCWKDSREALEEQTGKPWWEATADGWDHVASTCFLEDGHDGPHEFTPDTDIAVRFT